MLRDTSTVAFGKSIRKPGIASHEDQELLWIADTALQAEDPEGWVQQESPSGDTYYVNEVTKQVLWQPSNEQGRRT